jgi:hypothetical protein
MWQLIWRFPQIVVSQVTVVVSILAVIVIHDDWMIWGIPMALWLKKPLHYYTVVEDGEPPCSMFKSPEMT